MKKNLLLFFSALSIIACSSDDGAPSNDNDTSMGDYLPLTTNNYWVYDVEGEMPYGRDSIYVAGDMTANGHTYKKIQSDEPTFGFFSGSLNNNGVRKEGDRIMANGTASISFIADLPLSLDLQDFVILNEDAANGTVLSTVSGVLPYQYEQYTFNFNYTLSSVAQTALASYTAPNGEVYADVKAVKTVLNVSVTTLISAGGTSIPVTIMPVQDVVVSTRYFAKDVGVVHVSTDIQYEMSDFSSFGIDLPLPQSLSTHEDEVLVNYMVQ